MSQECAGGEEGFNRRQFIQASTVAGAAVALAPAMNFVGPSLPKLNARSTAYQDINWPAPPIISRATWGADESRRTNQQSWDSVVTKLIVHHTVTPNHSNPASTIRGIYNYHTANGYWDIAYNFLIDHHGNIYEGRWSGSNTGEVNGRNIRGAHAYGANTQSIGVALLGTFTSGLPTGAQRAALITLFAWKAARWGIDPLAADRYYDGRHFFNISGHRDSSSTACPGQAMYNTMHQLRHEVSARVGFEGSADPGPGLWMASSDGPLQVTGGAPLLGDPNRYGHAASSVVDVAAVPNGSAGYWIAESNGGIHSYGTARFYGSMGGRHLFRPMVGMAPTASGNGYWQVASDGGIFTFGDARFFGSTGGQHLNKPVVGMAPTPSGNGYWLVASDGGIFTFGDARFFGSTGGQRLNKPVVGMAPTPSGNGYWLVASDGGIFTFGDARFFGSMGGHRLNSPVSGMYASQTGNGYILYARDGGTFTFGDAIWWGSTVGQSRNVVAAAPYWHTA